METHEAVDEATEFLKDYPAEGFATTEAMIAAAILWGERLGIQRARSAALQALTEARDRLHS
jgi:hypothetical protein